MARKQNAFNLDSLMESERANLVPMPSPSPLASVENKVIGRPKSKRTCSRELGVAQTIYFTKEDKKLLNTTAFMSEVDQQDIVRCALRQFFKRYAAGNELTEEGRGLVLQYVEETTVK